MGFGLEITLFKLCVFIGSIYNLHVGKFCNRVYTSNLGKEQTMAVGFHKDQSCVKLFQCHYQIRKDLFRVDHKLLEI